MIVCKKVTKKINGQTLLSDITLKIEPKECICITGEARCGKTTLFNLLLKADEPTNGSIEVDGIALEDLPHLILQLYRSRLGIIFQEPQLLAHATVAENIAYPLELRDAPPNVIQRRTTELLKRFNLQAKADAFPSSVSLSERALVGIARAFVSSPMILLADEPLQLLDESQAQAALTLFQEAQRQGCTIVIFTSNPSLAEALDARTLTLSDGKIVEQTKGRELGKALASHRILETDDEIPLTEFSAAPSESPSASRTSKEKKKVKITSINS